MLHFFEVTLLCYQVSTKEMNTVEEIKEHLAFGDWGKVAKMAGVTRKHAIVIMGRPGSKRYNDVVTAAKKIALANIKLGI